MGCIWTRIWLGTWLKGEAFICTLAIWFISLLYNGAVASHCEFICTSSIISFKSYSAYAGVQGCFLFSGGSRVTIAVAIFLDHTILGLMYYFLPKAANRPIYSYSSRSSTFGPWFSLYVGRSHHFAYTSLPEWLKVLRYRILSNVQHLLGVRMVNGFAGHLRCLG